MKGILFNGEMVNAILNGTKSVTRRVIKPQPLIIENDKRKREPLAFWANGSHWVKPPYTTGMTLYVRETWCPGYYADGSADGRVGYRAETKWRPSIHMPKEAARIFLRVVGVRVERLQEITEDGARAEGIGPPLFTSADIEDLGHVECFSDLWDHINEKRGYGWDTNPWVWVIEFERTEKP